MCFCWLSGVVWISDRVQLTEVHMVSDYFGLHRFRGLWRMLSYWFGVFQSLPVWDRAESWKGHGPPASSVALERLSRVVWWTKPFTFPKHSNHLEMPRSSVTIFLAWVRFNVSWFMTFDYRIFQQSPRAARAKDGGQGRRGREEGPFPAAVVHGVGMTKLRKPFGPKKQKFFLWKNMCMVTSAQAKWMYDPLLWRFKRQSGCGGDWKGNFPS